MAAISISPAVTVTEIDNTLTVPVVATTIGAYVGHFHWGPVDFPILVSTPDVLTSFFQEPDNTNYLDFFSAYNFLSYGNNLQLVRSLNANSNNATANASGILIKNPDVWHTQYSNGQSSGTTGPFAAKYPGVYGNSISVSVCPSANAWGATLTATANTSTTSNVIIFSTSVTGMITTGDKLTVANTTYTVQNVVASNVTVNSTPGANLTAQTASRAWAYQSYFPTAPGTTSYAENLNGANDEMHMVVLDAGGTFSGVAGTVLETYPFLSKASDATNNDGTSDYISTVLFDQSRYVYWMGQLPGGTNWGNTAANTTFTEVDTNYYVRLGGGATVAPTDADRINSWGPFADAGSIDISLAITGACSPTVGLWVIQNVAEERMDTVAFVSPLSSDIIQVPGYELTNVLNTRNNLYDYSSSYAVMDCNWKYQFDNYNNVYRWLPCNPDIAGLCVRTDLTNNPWWSPAGYNRGLIKNAIKLAWNPKKSERDALYAVGVDPVVNFTDSGPMLYGDKTLTVKPSAFGYINVRRLFIVLEKSIATAAKYSLFEFNDIVTQTNFVNLVTPYLQQVQGGRGITTFKVVCDSTNNTPEVINQHGFVGDIYIIPNLSINWIQLNFIAEPAGWTFNEIQGSSPPGL